MFVILVWPVLAWVISLFKVVFAPPNQGFSVLCYLPVCLMGLPACSVFAFQKRLLGRKLLAGLALAFIAPIILFLFAAPLWMPGGMSNCKQAEAPYPKVRYECVDSSSDHPEYHREFIVEGRKGWPLMQIVEE